MSMSIGIVGMPNVGKSTLFHALTKNPVEMANYPFCTVAPNVGIVSVPDPRLEQLTQMSQSQKTIPAVIEFVDIAGLIKGAHKGEGLGNAFLSHIREVDAICHVVRAFANDSIIHVNGQINPPDDMETIHTELILADLDGVQKRLDMSKRQTKANPEKTLLEHITILEKAIQTLNSGFLLSHGSWSEDEQIFLRSLQLLTYKPMIYVVNVSEAEIHANISLPGIPSGAMLPLCIKLESELADLSPEDCELYKKEFSLESTGLERLITTSYQLLDLITFFTTGPKETRAWTIKKHTKAPQAAGKIHSDFERGFIVAETIHGADLLKAESWNAAKEQGLIMVRGKEYEVQDGDVMIFRSGV